VMPSVVKSSSTVDEEQSARAGNVRKPATSDVPRKRSQLLVSHESSRSVKSVERSGVAAASKGSSVGSRSSKLPDRSVRQKVDLAASASAASASTAASRVVSTRNAALKGARVKPQSSESVKSELCSNAVKTTSRAVAQLSTSKTAVHRKSIVETSRCADVSASANKRRSPTLTASVTSSVKHELPSSRNVRLAAASQSKTSTAAICAATKKPRLKPADGTPLATGQTLVKRNKVSSLSVQRQNEKKEVKTDGRDKSSSSKTSDSTNVSKVAALSSTSAAEVSDVGSESVDVSPEPLTPVSTNGSLHSDCIVHESCEDVAESSDKISYVYSESPLCESARGNMSHCDHISTSTSVILPITCVNENGSDLDETNICDISLNSCRSDCSTSLFHSACSSVVGSISDIKPPSLTGCLENDDLGTWSGSNSVSMESLQSSVGYCTPSEHDQCEAADFTLSSTADARFVSLLLLLSKFGVCIITCSNIFAYF